MIDCIVCGELCVDLSVFPLDQDVPLSQMGTVRVEPIQLGSGGVVSNSGMSLARLGMSTAAIGKVGADHWGEFLRRRFRDAGMDVTGIAVDPDHPTSVTVVLIGPDGEHAFAYHGGASQTLDAHALRAQLPRFAEAHFALFGYYHLMPQLESELPGLLAEIRGLGCRTALDTAAGGGALQPLDRILPQLDLYVPSYHEGRQQTGCDDPRAMIECYRQFCPDGLLGIKLGERGALLSPGKSQWIEIEPVPPPGPVRDTTGAGDSFYAGLIAALGKGYDVAKAGRFAAAVGACCVSGVGAIEGVRSFDQTLAWIEECDSA